MANSTIRMAFLAVRPTSITRPIWAYTLLSKCRDSSPRYAPSTATGVLSRTLKGNDQLS